MNLYKSIAGLLLLSLLIVPAKQSLAEDWAKDAQLYTAVDEEGHTLFTRSGAIYEGDEYISADNMLYRIISISGNTAAARLIGPEEMPDVAWLDAGDIQAVFAPALPAAAKHDQAERKLIAMYVTHSDESYIPSDGTQSINGQGGIYDVAREFRDALQSKGIDVILDESTHLPHDSGAYRRSRQTAERLLQKRPDAIIDIHRDGIPDQSEYTCTIDGENASQVRLLVGRSNQNSDVNRAFAKEIKAVADKQYPGLIKDIFIGKGNYNQDLSPNAILLEFGTHTISKERVLNSTDMMADVVSTTLYGKQTAGAKSDAPAAQAKEEKSSRSPLSGILLMAAVVITGILVFSFLQTGGGSAMKTKLRRNLSELTSGMMGSKRKNTK